MKVKPIFFLYQSGSLPETAAMEGYLKDFKEKFRDEFFWIFGINLYPGPTLLTLSQVFAIRGYLRIGHTFLILRGFVRGKFTHPVGRESAAPPAISAISIPMPTGAPEKKSKV